MPAAASIIGQCPDCCTCPTATVEWDSRSASKSKMGVLECVGFASTPARVYRRVNYSGVTDGLDSLFSRNRISQSGHIELVDPPPSGYSLAFRSYWEQRDQKTSAFASCGASFTSDTTFTRSNATIGGDSYIAFASGVTCTFADANISAPAATCISATQRRIGGGSDPCSSEERVFDLADEYTTALLKSNTVAALPAWDSDWNDTAGSFANLSTDELSYAIRDARYRFRFKVPKVGQGCYRVSWVERFTPEGGGSPVDTPRCATWDGTIPGGYDPATPSTWPILGDGSNPYFELPPPASDGTTTIINIVAECVCDACP